MSAVLFAGALVCAAIATLLGFGAFSGSNVLGWLGASLALACVGFLVERVPRP